VGCGGLSEADVERIVEAKLEERPRFGDGEASALVEQWVADRLTGHFLSVVGASSGTLLLESCEKIDGLVEAYLGAGVWGVETKSPIESSGRKLTWRVWEESRVVGIITGEQEKYRIHGGMFPCFRAPVKQ